MTEHTNTDKILRIAFTAVSAIAVFLFFALSIPYHIRFQEQYQMFLFTGDYLREVIFVPGGVSDYLGRFFTQFFISIAAGAAILALLFAATQLLTFAVLKKEDKNFFTYILSFIPASILAIYFTNANALVGTFVAVLAGLACSLVPFKGNKFVRYLGAAILAAALYLTCGSLGVLVFAFASAYRQKDWIPAVLAVVLAAGLAFALQGKCDYPLSRLLTGIHYNRYHDNVPLLPWIAAATFGAIALLLTFLKKEVSRGLSIAIFIVIFVGSGVGFFLSRNDSMEELCKYTTLTREEKWNDIIKTATKIQPSTPLTTSCLNIALAKAGAISDWMFRYRQMGPDGLFYPYRREHMSPVPASVLFWNMGFLNTCQRLTFAAEEVIPDYQKSAWSHKRLAEIYLTSGQIDVARKRLEPLKYTLFYRKWALKTEKLLDNPELIDSHPLYGAIRKLSVKEDHESTFAVQAMRSPLELNVIENPHNKMALQYLLANSLVHLDLDGFAELLEKYGMEYASGRSFQEAYILFWSQDHDGPFGMPDFISQKTIDRFMRFNVDAMNRDEEYMWRYYSDTYWYFFMTHQDQEE